MSTFTKVLLILLALAALYGFIARYKKRDGRNQEQLLDEMSHDELVQLVLRIKPAATEGLDEAGIRTLNSEHLREIIRRSKNY